MVEKFDGREQVNDKKFIIFGSELDILSIFLIKCRLAQDKSSLHFALSIFHVNYNDTAININTSSTNYRNYSTL